MNSEIIYKARSTENKFHKFLLVSQIYYFLLVCCFLLWKHLIVSWALVVSQMQPHQTNQSIKFIKPSLKWTEDAESRKSLTSRDLIKNGFRQGWGMFLDQNHLILMHFSARKCRTTDNFLHFSLVSQFSPMIHCERIYRIFTNLLRTSSRVRKIYRFWPGAWPHS